MPLSLKSRLDPYDLTPMTSSSEQITVSAGSLKPQFIFCLSVDQDPVGLDVAVAPAFPSPFQGMIPVPRWQRLPGEQNPDKLNQLLLILALPD